LAAVVSSWAAASCTSEFGASRGSGDGGEQGDGAETGDGSGVCGDGVLGGGEECDGEDLGGATCESVSGGFEGGLLKCSSSCRFDTSECIPEGCGNGVIDLGEECDDGNDDNTDACLKVCRAAVCGDGFVWEGTEECDDANDVNTDSCLGDCTEASCGDGHLWEGVEECDDGNQVSTDGCTNECKLPVCGDGHVFEGVEECDDGNQSNTDDCTNDCLSATCGDGHVWEGVEECDGANLGGATCENLGFLQGDVGCASDCVLDTSSCIQCGDCKSCTKSECYRDIYWWQDPICTIPYGSCTPCHHWGPANPTHSDGSFFCAENGSWSPYWNGGPCDWVDTDYVEDCDECGSYQCP
jgi:cysteine-rich repeat protein